MTVLITGGTGTLGQHLTGMLEDAGHTVRIGSRSDPPENLPEEREWASMQIATEEGVRSGCTGVDTVVHLASSPFRPKLVDYEGTRNLVEAASDVGVSHFVYVSIVGVDHIPLNYYQQKFAAEQVVAQGSVPHSILRATQFHSLIDELFGALSRVPFVIPIPSGFKMQSVAAREVAERVHQCVEEGAGGRLTDFGGPHIHTLREMVTDWQHTRSVSKRPVSIPIPGATASAFRAGHNVVRDGDHGVVTWTEWLARETESYPARS